MASEAATQLLIQIMHGIKPNWSSGDSDHLNVDYKSELLEEAAEAMTIRQRNLDRLDQPLSPQEKVLFPNTDESNKHKIHHETSFLQLRPGYVGIMQGATG
ncbi:hypothetical protein QAD02_013001 [Eretmocerus hayati]|uniref:Uncharacterized protein n=1 Tax=Eretmocerus hayati TaxID=131215 RepID=A0ACC2P0Z2_9HYME|nr:hypothetical protein QAD02_013001 [Eretmocerus hayati]